ISNKFENNSTSLSQTSANLKTSISDFGKSIHEYVDRNNKLLNYQQETLQKTKDISEIYSARFETIENGLSGIFDQIQTGLKDYQKTTGENLNQYLKQFSTILTAAHQGLENNVSGLNDITEELTEQIEKLTRRK
ncbi:MAG: hypothetical protein JW870_08780, partial [Candidatus Delongbacteria bacterium]|nr:hypothetical protein [Candidatus Delongbacteria bacterium]